MEIENKLDEDFLFYLGFTNSYFNEMKDKSEAEHCKVNKSLNQWYNNAGPSKNPAGLKRTHSRHEPD